MVNWRWRRYLLNPRVGVTVHVNGEQRFVEQSAALTTHRFVDCLFTNILEVTASDQIVLEVRQAVAPSTTSVGIMQVDDFEFVPADVDSELVQNGSFEENGSFSSAGWTLITHQDSSNQNLLKSASRQQTFDVNYGYAKGIGQQALLLTQIGEACQQVAFPAAGVYELSFWVRSRVAMPSFNLWWGYNAVEGSIIDGATTNVAVVTPAIATTNFVRYAGVFTVPSAGTRTLRIRGMNDGVTCITTPSGKGTTLDANVFVDGVSVRCVSAPPPTVNPKLALELTDPAATLRLDFAGTLELGRLRLGGHSLEGMIDASHPSGRVTGPGAIYVTPKGTIVILR